MLSGRATDLVGAPRTEASRPMGTGGTRFTKKPVTIEAVQITAADFNGVEFDGSPFSDAPEWIRVALAQGVLVPVGQDTDYAVWDVRTNHGVVRAEPGDWIIQQVGGELYPCKDSVFQATYAPEGASLTGLPVSGYRPQSAEKVALANINKLVEEQVLHTLDGLAGRTDIDKRWLAIGRTAIENGFMAVNRSVFQPGRVALPGDLSTDAVEAPPFDQDTRSRGEPRVPRHEPPAAA